ncbi:MAG: M23 family metallopeptidase [Solirubrobacteraceae bacterium]|nr:M23 family metallopeptidase [Solirubrobacteraceae bacterium]
MAAAAARVVVVVVGDRQLATRIAAAAAAGLLAVLVLVAAPLAVLTSSGDGAGQITSGGTGIPIALVPVFNEASRVYSVNAYLLAAIADQESGFGSGSAWRTVNGSGCVGLMQMCVGGAGGDSWTPAKNAYRRGNRPSDYAFRTATHPEILDSFDNVMAATVHLRGKVGDQPIPRLDTLAYRALCGYYGACADGIAGNYAADVLARAKSWEQQAALQGSESAIPSLGAGAVMSWPVRGPVTSPFCESRSWEACHPGIDIGVPAGTKILAAAAGRVSLVQATSSSGGYGNFTCLDHSRAITTCYAHQSRILVRAGQAVGRGELIGLSGCTGRCFGDHLHFEVRERGRVVCPAPFLGAPSRPMCAAGASR